MHAVKVCEQSISSNMCKRLLFGLFLASSISIALAQKGDKAGEDQTPLVPAEKIPPAPVLSPEDALKSFTLEPGFKIQIVAAEPMVQEPVAIQWDPNGRLWVLEMRGFMPTPDGVGEDKPVARISMLEDVDGDGRMDKTTVMVDNLIMPRSFMLTSTGVLVAEPPKLWFYPFEGSKVGEREEIAGDYGKEADPRLGKQANPEHAANSLLWAMDNYVYSANWTARLKFDSGVWKREGTTSRGQWGLSQDDYGHLVYNSNSDQYRMDIVPSLYLSRNPAFRTTSGLNVDPIKNQHTYPARVTPGVNRGYQPGMLKDGKLISFTAACGPVIYRGNNFPAEYYGNAFVCEPSANLVKRNILEEKDGVVTGRQAYADHEFLASTDERFRPVNAYTGPDGALYIVDLHHGIIQHRYFLTSYLRKQSESRGLEAPNGIGRIYRIVADGGPLHARPALGKATLAELVNALSETNGWFRDTAQRMLVEKADPKAVPLLRTLATSSPNHLARIHALWTLDGLSGLDLPTLKKELSDSNPKVQAVAIRVAEPFLKRDEAPQVLPLLTALVSSPSREVARQLAFTLGESTDPAALTSLLKIAEKWGDDVITRDAIISGLFKRELDVIKLISKTESWYTDKPAARDFLVGLSKATFGGKKAARIAELLDLASDQKGWIQEAILQGVAANKPVAPRGGQPLAIRLVNLPKEPAGLTALEKTDRPAIQSYVKTINQLITWPGQPGYVAPPVVLPLNDEQKKQFDLGLGLYSGSCAACHQPSGYGQEGLAPPLADSEWAQGPEERIIRIVLQGIHGPVNVGERSYNLEMPGLSIFDDQQLAAILTYVRRAWDNIGDPVKPETVKKIREATAKREEAWTSPELLKLK
ncbi:MAG: dehydrogenase [Verrucomicrobiales bacterium]|nr:dehydrogenase [Verrucomicrobiales bacterium]